MRYLARQYAFPRLFTSLIIFCSIIASIGLFVTSLINNQSNSLNLLNTKHCLAIKNPQPRQICQQEQLDQILLTGNIIGAFDLINEYYQQDLLFQKQCHSFAHRIGEKGYEFFSRYKKVKLGDNTSHCGFGFYHGFLEALVFKTNDMALAREFCHNVALQTRETDKKAEGACYHGIGHGTVDGSDPRSQGDPYKIVKPGIELCEKVTDDTSFRYQCAGGIFNSLAIMYTQSQNGLQRNQEDPFKVCYGFKGYLLDACLHQMNTYIIALSDKNLKKVGVYLHKIPQNYNATNATDSTVSYLAASKQNSSGYEDIIQTCQGFRSDLVNYCIAGYAAGLIEFGPPGREYAAPIMFCQHQLLNEPQSNSCFKRILNYMKVIYSSSKLDLICGQVNEKYRIYCVG
jgi:hypothetical protein